MAKGSPLRTRFCALQVALLIAAAGCAESGPDSALPDFIPSKIATKFLVRNAAPEYPALAKMNYIQGRVSVQTFVDSGGEVTEVHIVKGHPFLAVATLKAIHNWLFTPAHDRQGPPNFLTYVEVQFSLQGRKYNQVPAKPETDLDRQVQPPELVDDVPPSENGKAVRMRVLVGADGKVLDSMPLGATADELREARRVLAGWSFRPAHWGAMPVPWYIEVSVPIAIWPTAEHRLQPVVQ